MTLGPIVFHRRPELDRAAMCCPEGLLDRVERHVFGIAEHRERLRAGGQHVKRGLLLHGPPGTGKTLTVRYVAGRARDHTIVVLAGGGLGMVRPACALARMLQPSIVVLEDVDLVAQHRGYVESNPLLFDILNQMDGIAEDADVAFCSRRTAPTCSNPPSRRVRDGSTSPCTCRSPMTPFGWA